MTFTDGDLTKSVIATDGFGDTNLKSTSTKHIWVDVVRGRNCTVKMYESEDEDTTTAEERNTQIGKDLTAGVADNLYPEPRRFFSITNSKHLTLVADKPCTVGFIILIES